MTVRTATPADRGRVGAALAAAFHDDPVFGWIHPDEARRKSVLPRLFALFAGAIGRHRASLVAGEGAGAALWVPPGETVVAADDAEAFGKAVLALAPDAAGRLAACSALLEGARPHEPCWYLNLLGVVPERQGRGVGSALLRPVLERCDREGVPAYLEATSTHNRGLYERHGFRTVRELPLPDGPSLWAMWRSPAGA